MSDTKGLNNEELEKVTGGEGGTSNHKYQIGDWVVCIGKDDLCVNYVKDIIKNRYRLILYTYTGEGRGSRFDSGYIKEDKGTISCEIFDLNHHYSKTNKPDWVTEDPSL